MNDFGIIGLAIAGDADAKLQKMRRGVQKLISDFERDAPYIKDPALKRYILDSAEELRQLL